MIVDLSELSGSDAHRHLDYDLCIVGAGPAGITLALELRGSGARICLLEAGGRRFDPRVQRLLEGEYEGDPYPPLRDTRVAAFGGTTHVWAGWCRPLEPIDFAGKPWLDDPAWPFPIAEMDPYYRRAHELLALGQYEYDPGHWETQTGHRGMPLPAGLVHRIFHVNASSFEPRFLQEIREASDIDLIPFAPAIRCVPDASGTRIVSVDVHTSDPHASNARSDGNTRSITARRFVLAAGGIENARLLLASATESTEGPGNRHDLVGRFFTDHVFLDFGRLVLADGPSSLDTYFPQQVASAWRTALERARTPAAAHLAQHLEAASHVGRQLEAIDRSRPYVRSTISLAEDTVRSLEVQNGAVFFHPRYESHPVFSTPEVKSLLVAWNKRKSRAVPGDAAAYWRRALARPDRLALATARKFLVGPGPAREWRMRGMFETESRPDNRITLSRQRDALGRPRARVAWRLSERDLRDMNRVVGFIGKSLEESGIGRIELDVPDEPDAWRRAIEAGKHPIGATRMHEDPRHGVVDENGKVHGIENLYVTGSSVFPGGGYANPTLTIVALAVRLGEHLKAG